MPNGAHSEARSSAIGRNVGSLDRGRPPDVGSWAMMISIPPQYAVSRGVGTIQGQSAIHLARVYGERKRNFVGQHFWARRSFVSTVGRDRATIRESIRNQEPEDQRLDPMNLWR
jgi:putative transposase